MRLEERLEYRRKMSLKRNLLTIRLTVASRGNLVKESEELRLKIAELDGLLLVN